MGNEDLAASLQGPADILFGKKKPKRQIHQDGPPIDVINVPLSMGDVVTDDRQLKAELGRRCAAGKILTKGFTRKDGTRVAPFCTTDKGAPGKGPKTLPKPKKGGLGGWKKEASEAVRHSALLGVARKEGCATAIRKMVLVENITTDAPTKALLRQDREWLRGQKSCKLKSKMDGAEIGRLPEVTPE